MNPFKKRLLNIYLKLFGKDQKSRNRKRLREKIKVTPLRVVVGAEGNFQQGWIGTEIDTLNLLKKRDWKMLFKPGIIDVILAEHVWEHLTDEEGQLALRNCFTYLKKGGYFRVAVPDGFHPDQNYIDYVKPGGHGAGADDHKLLYNYLLMKAYLEAAGFKVRLLEYFDENGVFHYNEWAPEDGLIRRSKRFDERNKNGQLNYTSLIIDGIK